MNEVVFRVNASKSDGIGHLVRCVNLAKALTKLDFHCHFILSQLSKQLIPFVHNFSYECLYRNLPCQLNVALDAKLTMISLEKRDIRCLVIDDYYLGKEWESFFYDEGITLVVIDDLLREHLCDVLLDFRWRGKGTLSAYEEKVPLAAQLLLGSEFVLLDEQYQGTSEIQAPQNQFFNILVGNGGGGDLKQLQDIIENILPLITRQPIKLMLIIGPMSNDTGPFISRYLNEPNVEIIQDCVDLFPYLQVCDLYIGAAGGILYQLLALNKPALTFAMADNQQNPISLLEDIGHYFHCDGQFIFQGIGNFVLSVAEHYQRVKNLPSKVKILDGFGSMRVAYAISGLKVDKEGLTIKHVARSACYIQLNENYRIRPVVDSDINHYLDSRNLSINTQNMIESKPIARLVHYAWWFNTQRSSYLLEKDNQACLYIWHQIQTYQKRQFLIGGWFVCQANASFQDALLALNWQLEHCDKHWPSLPWVAVIHRENRYVKLMNDYLGFKEVDVNNNYYDAVSSIFVDASPDEFYYVMREPLADPLLQITLS